MTKNELLDILARAMECNRITFGEPNSVKLCGEVHKGVGPLGPRDTQK